MTPAPRLQSTAPRRQPPAPGPPGYRPRIKAGARPGLYLVESRTRPGLAHQCHAGSGRCSCAAGKRGRRCWHLGIARQLDSWRMQTAR